MGHELLIILFNYAPAVAIYFDHRDKINKTDNHNSKLFYIKNIFKFHNNVYISFLKEVL